MTTTKLDLVDVGPYRELYAHHLAKQAYDEAWCVAATLCFLKKAGAEEKQFHEDYRPHGLPHVSSRVDPDSWRARIFSEDENPRVGKIFEHLAPAALHCKREQLKSSREEPVLDSRYRQDPATSAVLLARIFGWAANVLGLPVPQLYIRNDIPSALTHLPVSPPASIAGQTLLAGLAPQELLFIIGKHLAYYRAEHYICTIFPTVGELTMLFLAGIQLVVPDQPLPPEIAKSALDVAKSLNIHMQPSDREGLQVAVRAFIQTDRAKTNIKRWAQCAEIASLRAGFLLCGDLETARKWIAAEPVTPNELSPQDKLKELLAFSVSEGYFKLRAQLGLAIRLDQ